MPSEVLLLCPCDRRYAQTTIVKAETERGLEFCPCGRMLGAWDGLYCLRFEPEAGAGRGSYHLKVLMRDRRHRRVCRPNAKPDPFTGRSGRVLN